MKDANWLLLARSRRDLSIARAKASRIRKPPFYPIKLRGTNRPAGGKNKHFGVIHVVCKRVLNMVLTSSDSRHGIRLFYQWKNDRRGEGGITLPASAAIMLPA